MEERTHGGKAPEFLPEAENAATAAPAPSAEGADQAAGEPADSCLICGRSRAEGIHICDAFICEECEREMVETDADDAKYPYFIMRMRQIWHRLNA
jgi:hypothetical protein